MSWTKKYFEKKNQSHRSMAEHLISLHYMLIKKHAVGFLFWLFQQEEKTTFFRNIFYISFYLSFEPIEKCTANFPS